MKDLDVDRIIVGDIHFFVSFFLELDPPKVELELLEPVAGLHDDDALDTTEPHGVHGAHQGPIEDMDWNGDHHVVCLDQ